MSMANLMVRAGLEGTDFSGEQVSARLPIEPGLYLDQTELLLSNLHPSAELTVYGPISALSSMEVCLAHHCILNMILYFVTFMNFQ